MNSTSPDNAQDMLADSARSYLERGYTATVRAGSLAHSHGCAPQRWREFADLGWLALPLAEADGGLGGSLDDACVLAEQLGRAVVVEPWVACGVLAATLLAGTGSGAQRAQWLPAMAAGDRRIAFAAWEPGSRFDAQVVTTRAERTGDGYRLHGAKELVLGAPGADALIVAAQCADDTGAPGLALFIVDTGAAGVVLQGFAMIDGRHAANVALQGVFVAADARLGASGDVAEQVSLAIDRAIVVQCAETTGVMARAFEITLDYVKTRKQFGRVLAANQALQHRLVDLQVAIEETRALVRAAARAFDGPQAQRPALVAAAKAYASQAARQTWEETVQMHGAIGMTDEYVLSSTTRHLAASHALFGDTEQHLERLAEIEDQQHATLVTTPMAAPARHGSY